METKEQYKTTTASSTGKCNKENEETMAEASKARGRTISSLVRRFRESPPLPREQRHASLGVSSQTQGNSDFWWIEVGDNTSSLSSDGVTQMDRSTTSTPSFFDVETLDADVVLAKSRRIAEDDAQHNEMVDRLRKKYLHSDGQTSTPSLVNEVDWGCTIGQDRMNFSSEEKEPSDVLEEWRRRWKKEIDISSPVKARSSSDVDVEPSWDSLLSSIKVSTVSSGVFDFSNGASQRGMGIENNFFCQGGSEVLGGSVGFPKLDQKDECLMTLASPEGKQSEMQFDWLKGVDETRKRRDSSDMDIDSPEPLRLQSERNSGDTAQCSYQACSSWQSRNGDFPSSAGIEGSPMDVDDRHNNWKGQQDTSFFVSFAKPSARWDRPPLPRRLGAAITSNLSTCDEMDEDRRSPTMGVVSTLVECTVTNFLFSSADVDSPNQSAMDIVSEGSKGIEISFFDRDP